MLFLLAAELRSLDMSQALAKRDQILEKIDEILRQELDANSTKLGGSIASGVGQGLGALASGKSAVNATRNLKKSVDFDAAPRPGQIQMDTDQLKAVRDGTMPQFEASRNSLRAQHAKDLQKDPEPGETKPQQIARLDAKLKEDLARSEKQEDDFETFLSDQTRTAKPPVDDEAKRVFLERSRVDTTIGNAQSGALNAGGNMAAASVNFEAGTQEAYVKREESIKAAQERDLGLKMEWAGASKDLITGAIRFQQDIAEEKQRTLNNINSHC
jgi:hypothetical protein